MGLLAPERPDSRLFRSSLLLLILLFSLYSQCRALCNNLCNNHGTCDDFDRCHCYKDTSGHPMFTGYDCSLRVCPMGTAWVGDVVSSNNNHPMAECSNKGECDRRSGLCNCESNFDGLACERTICPNDCSGQGECFTQMQLAEEAGRTYSTPWDATKNVGCVCDMGFRGPDCSMIECPTGPDVLNGYGNEAGRDCSGRGICDYDKGVCECFVGYSGYRCQYQVSIIVAA